METTHPFAPETCRRERLRFAFMHGKGGKRPGFYRLDRRIPGHPDWLAERAGSEPYYGGRMTIHCRLWISLLCTTALLPLCRSEAQLNPDEKGRSWRLDQPPLDRRGSGPRAAYSELSLMP